MTDEVADIAARLRFVQVLLVDEREVEVEFPGIHDWLGEALHAKVLLGEGYLLRPSVCRQFFVFNIREKLGRPFFQDVQFLSSQDDQLHAIRRVVLAVEFHEFVPHVDTFGFRLNLQNLEITCGEVAVRVFGIRERLLELVQSPCVALQVLLVLGVNSLKLAVQCAR